MGLWLHRLARQATVLVAALITAAFFVGDAEGWSIQFRGKELDIEWLLVASFILFFAIVLWRLVQQEAHLDQKAEIRAAIQALTPFVRSGNRLLEMYGRPYSPGQPPMLMVDHGLPDINEWYRQIAPVMEKVVPEYVAAWENDGPIYDDSSRKAVAIQQLEGRLSRLGDIMTELRERL